MWSVLWQGFEVAGEVCLSLAFDHAYHHGLSVPRADFGVLG